MIPSVPFTISFPHLMMKKHEFYYWYYFFPIYNVVEILGLFIISYQIYLYILIGHKMPTKHFYCASCSYAHIHICARPLAITLKNFRFRTEILLHPLPLLILYTSYALEWAHSFFTRSIQTKKEAFHKFWLLNYI